MKLYGPAHPHTPLLSSPPGLRAARQLREVAATGKAGCGLVRVGSLRRHPYQEGGHFFPGFWRVLGTGMHPSLCAGTGSGKEEGCLLPHCWVGRCWGRAVDPYPRPTLPGAGQGLGCCRGRWTLACRKQHPGLPGSESLAQQSVGRVGEETGPRLDRRGCRCATPGPQSCGR